MLSKHAAAHLRAEQSRTQTEVTVLERMAAEVEGKLQAERLKLAWLQSQLQASNLPPEPPPSTPDPPAIEIIEVPNQVANAVETAGLGLRYHIRTVLHDATKGLRPKDIHAEMIKRGVKFSEGKSDPMLRTYNELYRMAKVGQIRKRGMLYYQQETH